MRMEYYWRPHPSINKDKDQKKINVSSKRTINYQNENTDLCIYYEVDNSIEAGNYKIEIFAEGFLIGKTSLGLR